MKKFVSPRQVALAIDVSESSLKRWCDQGLIPTVKTAGGHRRLPIGAVADFLRRRGHRIVRPELLGLPAIKGQTTRVTRRAEEQLITALLHGDSPSCRRLLADLYLAGHSIAEIGDELIAPAFEAIGNRWECGEAEIYEERRGCEVARRAITELGDLIPAPPPSAPFALCASGSHDQYQLPSLLVELVLRSLGWRAVLLGGNLPPETLLAAIKQQNPALFCLSVSYIASPPEFVSGLERLREGVPPGPTLVLGGRVVRKLPDEVQQQFTVLDKLAELESMIQ